MATDANTICHCAVALFSGRLAWDKLVGWTDGRTDELADGRTGGRTGGLADGRTTEQMLGRTKSNRLHWDR